MVTDKGGLLDNSTRARRAILALQIFLAYAVTMLFFNYSDYNLLTLIYEGVVISIFELDMNNMLRFIFSFAYLAVLAGTFITFLRWFYRAYNNLHIAGVSGLRYKPIWTIASFVIPVINLFRPYIIMKDIWIGNIQLTKDLSSDLVKIKPPVGWWWILCLLTFASCIMVIFESVQGGSISQVINTYYFSILADTFFLLSAAVAIIVIRIISRAESATYKNQL